MSAPLLALVSSKSEWRAVKAHYPHASVSTTPYGEQFELHLEKNHFIFCQGGVGKVSAAASTDYAVQRWQPRAVVNPGTCGGIAGEIEIGEIVLARQTVIVTLTVRNPNDRPLPIKAMTGRLQIEGNEVARGASTLDRQIPAFGDALVDLDVEGSLVGLIQQLPSLSLKDAPLDWTVSGTVTVADGFLILPYRYSGQVDAKTLLSRGFVR